MLINVTIEFDGIELDVEGEVTMPSKGDYLTPSTSLTFVVESIYLNGQDIQGWLNGGALKQITQLASEKAEKDLL